MTGGAPCCPWLVTTLHTERLALHPVDVVEAERIVAGRRGPEDCWAPDFPFAGDVIALTAFLRATAVHGDPHPFGPYRVTRSADGQAIGGIGFKGRPVEGSVEIGYGLVPSARGHGYAAEAVQALVALARQQGLSRVVADTDADNIASQRTLERTGFMQIGTRGDLRRYAMVLIP